MSTHRYPRRVLIIAGLRSAVGVLLTGGPLAMIEAGYFVTAILGGFCTLFLLYGGRAIIRAGVTIRVQEDGLSVGKRKNVIKWSDLTAIRLGYYSTQRPGSRQSSMDAGWMQLGLTAGGKQVRLDSTLDGFAIIAAAAARAALDADIPVDPATRANLAALNIDPPPRTSTGSPAETFHG